MSSSEVCRKDDEGCRREGGVAFTLKAALIWGAQAKALIISSEAGTKAAERDIADWKKKSNPSSPTLNQPRTCLKSPIQELLLEVIRS